MRSIESALDITLNSQGRVLRNLIHGADTVMSHILHFYHLAAADFVNVSPASGILGSPWDDGMGGNAFGSPSTAQFVSLTQVNSLVGTTTSRLTGQLVESYVAALNIRKQAHTMSAILSGRHPIQNAIVPGGVTTLFTDADKTAFSGHLDAIRNFINRYYIPDVVFVATRTTLNWHQYWLVGTNPGRVLSYGEFPLAGAEGPFDGVTNNNLMLLSRGAATYTGSTSAFNIDLITEYVDYSFYVNPGAQKPGSGTTSPLTGAALSTALASGPQYSWLKAPRYNSLPHEVGPLARMFVTYLTTGTKTASEGTTFGLSAATGGAIGLPTTYSVAQLVDGTLQAGGSIAVGSTTYLSASNLFSPLGRHACRALECKLIADKMADWVNELSTSQAAGTTTDGRSTYNTTVATGSGYVYQKIPKSTVSGAGLAEAPRGALGHWITITSKKISNYQCVVPSTWNCCPKGSGPTDRGPAEAALIGVPAGSNTDDAIVNIARMLHPYDFCIACAVHVVNAEGKEVAKFKMDLDGGIKKL